MQQRPQLPQNQNEQDVERQQRRQQLNQAAVQSAAASDSVRDSLEDVNLVEELGEPQIADEEWKKKFPWETTRHNAYTYITDEEYEERRYENKANARLARGEHPEHGGVGSLCQGAMRKTMLADPNATDRRFLDDELDRQIDGFFDDVTRRMSLGRDGKLLEKTLETHVVTRDESPDAADESGSGILSKAAGVLGR